MPVALQHINSSCWHQKRWMLSAVAAALAAISASKPSCAVLAAAISCAPCALAARPWTSHPQADPCLQDKRDYTCSKRHNKRVNHCRMQELTLLLQPQHRCHAVHLLHATCEWEGMQHAAAAQHTNTWAARHTSCSSTPHAWCRTNPGCYTGCWHSHPTPTSILPTCVSPAWRASASKV